MTKRDLPSVSLGARTGVRSDVSQSALQRWEPGLRAALADEQQATISIMDVIGQDFWGEGVTAKRIAGALRSIGDQPVTVTINSPGGDVFEGLAIYNLLREHPGEITVKIVGLAASAASFIAMAGDRIEIGKAAFLMIHNSWVVAMGDRQALRDVADWLEPFDDAMVGIYNARTGMAETDISAMMDAETWINGSKSVDLGFADDFLPNDQVSVTSENGAAAAVRAERCFDILATRAGLTRSASKELLASLKGGTSGTALTSMPGAADIEAQVAGLQALINSI